MLTDWQTNKPTDKMKTFPHWLTSLQLEMHRQAERCHTAFLDADVMAVQSRWAGRTWFSRPAYIIWPARCGQINVLHASRRGPTWTARLTQSHWRRRESWFAGHIWHAAVQGQWWLTYLGWLGTGTRRQWTWWAHCHCQQIVDAGERGFGYAASRSRKSHVLSLIHIWRCRRSTLCRSRWSPYH